MPAKDTACLLACVGRELVQSAQQQAHQLVWRTWYKPQTTGHFKQAVNLGIVGAIPSVALIHIGDVGYILKKRRRSAVRVHRQVRLHRLKLNSIAHVNGCGIRWHGAGVQYIPRWGRHAKVD
eukprot:4525098-Pleurochrysis_carterae.AAC.2